MAKNIAQGGRPVALMGSAIPDQFEFCPERRYFTELRYLALVCDDDLLEARLRARPAWRASASEETLARMLAFNRWLREHAATTTPPMTLLDTSRITVEQSLAETMAWLRRYWPPQAG